MGRFIDLTGEVFGRLKVVKRLPNDDNNKAVWLCECKCGRTVILSSNLLKFKKYVSCGECGYLSTGYLKKYLKKEKVRKKRTSKIYLNNLKDKKFGKITVVEYFGKSKDGHSLWTCKCKCGNIKVILGKSLVSGGTKSCGCLLKKNGNFKNLNKKIFGKLLVTKHYFKSKNGYMWKCICFCGNEKYILSRSLIAGSTISCGCLSESLIASEIKKYCVEKFGAKKEYRIFKNPITNKFLPYDIFIPDGNVFIEIQGQQHFIFVKRWHKTKEGFDYQKKKDLLKKRFAMKNGKFIIVDLRKLFTVEDSIAFIESNL